MKIEVNQWDLVWACGVVLMLAGGFSVSVGFGLFLIGGLVAIVGYMGATKKWDSFLQSSGPKKGT